MIALTRELEHFIHTDLEVLPFVDLSHIDTDLKHLRVSILVMAYVVTLGVIQTLLVQEFLEEGLRNVLETHRVPGHVQLIELSRVSNDICRHASVVD